MPARYGVVRLVRWAADNKLYAMKSVDKWALIERRNTGDQRVVGYRAVWVVLHPVG